MNKPRAARLLLAAIAVMAAALTLYFLALRPKVPRARRVVRDPEANVLLITLDTTRPDRLGAYGDTKAATPEIDRLAASGALFENAYSPVPMTLPAHVSILTGTTPLFHGLHLNGRSVLTPEAVTLATVLKASGRETAAFVSSFVLDSRFGLDLGFDYYGDTMEDPGRIKNLESERRAETTFRDFSSWMDRRPPGRFFAWVHFYDPHYPYDPPEPYRSDPRFSNLYDGEIAVMDHFVGETVRLLEAKGLEGSTLVILAGDHGEAFGEHGENGGHTIFAYEENIRVPLILWSAGGVPVGTRIGGRAGLIDIFPTVLDYLKIKAPAFVQGRSLLPHLQGREVPGRDLYFESDYFNDIFGCAPVRGVLSGRHKYIELPRPELYDLAADPAEHTNLAGDGGSAGRLAASREALANLERSQSGGVWASGRALSDEARRRLESLGYLSGGNRTAAGPACDPKDKIGFWNRSLEAKELLAAGKTEPAERLLLSLFAEDPRFGPVVEDLGDLYFGQKKVGPLNSLFGKAISADPGSAGMRIVYGRFLVRLGLAAEAVAVLEAAGPLAGPGELEQVHFTLANAFGQLGRYDEAARSFEKVLDLEPANFEAARLLGSVLMRQGKYEDALRSLARAEEGLPRDARLLEAKATSLAELGRFAEALPYFERAVAAGPSASLYANYAVACAATGDYARASDLMRTALGRPDADPELRALGQRYLLDWAAQQ